MDEQVQLTGMAAKTRLENVFICQLDASVVVTSATEEPCPVCKRPMENTGWFESGNKV